MRRCLRSAWGMASKRGGECSSTGASTRALFQGFQGRSETGRAFVSPESFVSRGVFLWRGISTSSVEEVGDVMPIARLEDKDVSASVRELCDRLALLKNREVNQVVPLMKDWESKGNCLDKATVNSILLKLRQWKRPRHAMEIADWMYFRRPFPLDLNDTIMRMEMAARSELLKKALRIFKNLKVWEKTVDAYNVMFLMCSQHKMILHADDLYHKFKEARLKPNDYTFSILACLYRRCGLFLKLIRLQDDMASAGVKPCTCYLNNLLTAKYETEGIEAAEEVFNRLIPPGTTELAQKHMATLSMMASAYMSAGLHEKAQKLMADIENGLDSGSFVRLRRTYHILISMYSTLKDFPAMERLWGKIEEQKAHDYMAMIEACGRAGSVDKAERYFNEADRLGIADLPRMYSSLFKVYAEATLPDKSEALFKKMKARNVSRCSFCYHYMILANLNSRRISRALDLLELAQVAGKQDGNAKPAIGTLADVLKTLAEVGEVVQAETVFGDWRKAKLRVNPSHYNLLLRVYLKAGKQVEGDFLKRMAGNGVRPNVETHKLLEELSSVKGETVTGFYL